MGLMPHREDRFPRCRDDQTILCSRNACEWNMGKSCSVPSLCVIGEDGKCEGFGPKKPKTGPIDGD